MDEKWPGMVNTNGYTYKQALKSVGKGWHKLLRTAFYYKPSSVKIVQVKEKFGTLTIYIEGIYDQAPIKEFKEYRNLIDALGAYSSMICEWCGAYGNLDTKYYWMLTLCEKCKTKRDKEKANEKL
jgi:hypothetical protein